MATPENKSNIGLTRDDLLAILAEVRKPVKSEKELREERDLQNDRLAMMETLKQKAENEKRNQEACSHKRRDGSTTAVYVVDLNRLYCQACQKWIFPHIEPKLFNDLYQLAL